MDGGLILARASEATSCSCLIMSHPIASSMHEIMLDATAVGKIQLMNSMQTDQVEAKPIGENNQRQGCTYQLLLQIISKTYNLLTT